MHRLRKSLRVGCTYDCKEITKIIPARNRSEVGGLFVLNIHHRDTPILFEQMSLCLVKVAVVFPLLKPARYHRR
ncbi:hypothetical protein KCU95_g102, partial [Aureobasidium melanogenum]